MINSNKVEVIKEHLEEIMNILEISRTASNIDTPRRIAKMWCNEVFKNRNNENIEELNDKMKLFPNDYKSELIIVKDIEFNSICEHHWLPFSGKISIGYVPSDSIIGLSKIPRVVKYFSQKPQLQEKLVKEIADYLEELLNPKALFIRAEAVHQCVKCRGAESNCSTVNYYHSEYGTEYFNEFKSEVGGK